MTWIKMRTNLWDDPRVVRLCDLLGLPEATVVGGLYRLWSIADDHTTDGDLSGMSPAALDRRVGIDGFAAALSKVGWLEVSDAGIRIPRFDEHNGASAKRRAQTARRVAKHAKRSTRSANASSVRTPLAREEKKREEKKRGSFTECVLQEAHYAEFLRAWNGTPGVRPMRKWTPARRRKFALRVRDPDWDWRAALRKFPLACFRDSDGYRPDVDWFLRPDTVTKILEGAYDWTKNNSGKDRPRSAAEAYQPAGSDIDHTF